MWLPARYTYAACLAMLLLTIMVLPSRLGYSWRSPVHSTLSVSPDAGIPQKIWQIYLPRKGKEEEHLDPEKLDTTASWLALNPGYQYKLVGSRLADYFVQLYGGNETVTQTYHALGNVGMKSDLLRYLILAREGGVYADTDVIDIKPIDEWVPEHLQDTVNLIIGIEFDQADGGHWAEIPHFLQFAQWTIAARPGHPFFMEMVGRVLYSTDELKRTYNLPLEEINPTSFEVMNSTGPAAFTDVIWDQLRQRDSSLTELKDLTGMTEPRVIGDIMVLPIDGFGMGQAHSHSTTEGIPDAALVKHTFKGSWRGDD